MQFKKALVTGGAGFIGSNLVNLLLDSGCLVSVIDNLSTGNLQNLKNVRDKITFYKGDIRCKDLVIKATKNCDVIFHQAAVVSVPQTVDDPYVSAMVNEIGTLSLFEAARENKVKKIVFASSCAVYGDDPQLPKHEKMEPKPKSPYAVQKLVGEYYARLYYELYGVETVCLRYFNVYGPRQDPTSVYSGVISVFLTNAVLKKRPVIYGNGCQSRDFIFVKDVVYANLLAANSKKANGKKINIGTGKVVQIKRLWELVSDLAGFFIEPEYSQSRPGDIDASVASIDCAKSTFGFSPQFSFEKGLEATFKWYKKGSAT